MNKLNHYVACGDCIEHHYLNVTDGDPAEELERWIEFMSYHEKHRIRLIVD